MINVRLLNEPVVITNIAKKKKSILNAVKVLLLIICPTVLEVCFSVALDIPAAALLLASAVVNPILWSVIFITPLIVK